MKLHEVSFRNPECNRMWTGGDVILRQLDMLSKGVKAFRENIIEKKEQCPCKEVRRAFTTQRPVEFYPQILHLPSFHILVDLALRQISLSGFQHTDHIFSSGKILGASPSPEQIKCLLQADIEMTDGV